MIQIVKLNLLVDLETATDEAGRPVWRATAKSADMSADGQTPEAAVSALKALFLDAENQKIRQARQQEQLPKPKVVAAPVEEEPEENEESNEGGDPEAEEVEEAKDPEPSPEIDLKKLKVSELVDLAKEHDIEWDGLRKSELVAALEAVV